MSFRTEIFFRAAKKNDVRNPINRGRELLSATIEGIASSSLRDFLAMTHKLFYRVIFFLVRIHQRRLPLPRVFAFGNIHRAVEAFAEYLKRVIKRTETVCDANIILHLDHAAVIEFDNLAAGRANQMIVVGTVNCFFVLSMALRKPVP